MDILETINQIFTNLLHSSLTTKIFVVASISILGTIQFFIFKLHWLLRIAFFLTLHLLFALFLSKISGYNVKVHLLLYVIPSFLLALIIAFIFPSQETTSQNQTNRFNIQIEFTTKSGKKIINYNPFNGIYICAGPGSGKTVTFVKPLIPQFAKYGLTGIFYDYKRFDITRTVYTHYQGTKIPVRVVDFVDMSLTNKVNPLDPTLMLSPAYAKEFSHILFENTKDGEGKDDPFFVPSAEGILAGVTWKLKEDYPEYCNLPYVVAICLNPNYKAMGAFILSNKQAALLASSFLQVLESEKTCTAITATLSNALSRFALPELFYVLSGSDFSLDLNNPSCPGVMCINNFKPLEDSLAPIIALTISVALKNLNNPGKLPSCVLIDEGSTIKLPGFDNTPATGRENGIISVFTVQDKTQVVGKYGQNGCEKILNNLMMHVYGLTRNSKLAKEYSEMMGEKEKEYKSRTSGSTSNSSTISTRKEAIYNSQTFTELAVGEFYGLIASGNVKKFNHVFRPYLQTDLSLPMIKNISDSFVKENFNTILSNAQELINSQVSTENVEP
jgi:type IV secretory pathway TraG/TraD family ATPase VirD4